MADNDRLTDSQYAESVKRFSDERTRYAPDALMASVSRCELCQTKHLEDCAIENLQAQVIKANSEIVANLQHIDVLKEREARLTAKIWQLQGGGVERHRLNVIQQAQRLVIEKREKAVEKLGKGDKALEDILTHLIYDETDD